MFCHVITTTNTGIGPPSPRVLTTRNVSMRFHYPESARRPIAEQEATCIHGSVLVNIARLSAGTRVHPSPGTNHSPF